MAEITNNRFNLHPNPVQGFQIYWHFLIILQCLSIKNEGLQCHLCRVPCSLPWRVIYRENLKFALNSQTSRRRNGMAIPKGFKVLTCIYLFTISLCFIVMLHKLLVNSHFQFSYNLRHTSFYDWLSGSWKIPK